MSLRSLLALAGALVALAAPATAQAQAQVTPDEAAQLGREAYRYGIPLLELLRIRTEMTSVRAPALATMSSLRPVTSTRRPAAAVFSGVVIMLSISGAFHG